jgi:NADH-quinone oxidoreductase subunit L
MPLWLIPALPLAGFLVNGLLGRRGPSAASGLVACGAVGASFIVALLAFRELLALPAGSRVIEEVAYSWVASGPFRADFALLLDPLSAAMTLVVTGVGFLIHVYSTAYMEHDEGLSRYFAYLNLFTFAMLVLVLANNYLLMFVGWEGVGLCSYLLIGFWYEKPSAANAGKKAFVVNRIGDVGFALGVMAIFALFGSLAYTEVLPKAAGTLDHAAATAIAALLFIGAIGKSAQIPLYVWLPDAMEGPTPVSALIHAATMVTAGVYMVARSSAIYVLAPEVMAVVALVGAVTAVFAASIGLVQNDIKRVLAYSTVSQLGYMFLAAGVGAFSAAIFHLVTHAFFKALLFLGSGSVIHALGGEQDVRKMGGLLRVLPTTYWTFLIGTLAIAGIPPLAGFFSKDEILFGAFGAGPLGKLLWLVGIVTAGLTSFYMFRLLFLTFHGEPRMSEEVKRHVHESPLPMTLPLIALAVGSVVAGFLNVPHALGGHAALSEFLSPALATTAAGHGAAAAAQGDTVTLAVELALMVLSVAVAVVGWLVAYRFYLLDPTAVRRLVQRYRGAYETLLNKYWVDELYDRLFVEPFVRGSNWLWLRVDAGTIDGAVNGVGATFTGGAAALRLVQSGQAQSYAFYTMLGVLAVLLYVLTWGRP